MSRFAYLLVYSSSQKTRAQVQDHIDKVPEILNWLACFSAGLFIVSRKSAEELSSLLKPYFGSDTFFIVDVDSDRAGWMSRNAWDFIKNKKSLND